MRRLREELQCWWGLYLVALAMIAAIVFDAELPLPKSWQMVLLMLITIGTCVSALRWVRRNHAYWE